MVRCAESNPSFKIIGFIRESRNLVQRTVLSRPDILLVHADLLEAIPAGWLNEVRREQPKLCVLICGHNRKACAAAGALRELNVQFLDISQCGESDERFRRFLTEIAHAAVSVESSATRPEAASLRSTVIVAPAPQAGRPRRRGGIQAVVIGVSTGGPEALTEIFRAIDKDFPVPIAIVQHMPPMFTSMLADRLNRICPLEVSEAKPGMPFVPGQVVLAKGGSHMRLRGPAGNLTIHLDDGAPVNSCRPAVDVLFDSAAEAFGRNVITIVLTGMGKDGLAGAEKLHALGAPILVQDAATSTVWGMPGAIVQAGLASSVLPLTEIVPEMMRYL
jgi:two-component system chemotaxis response regulator CheB